MKFLYFYRVPVPDPRADAIQIVNTCAGISRAGGDVILHVETNESRSVAECLEYYGAAASGSGSGGLDIVPLGRHWSWPFFNWKTSRALREVAGSRACLFVREVRPYVPWLMARAKEAGLRLIFEAHNVSAALVQEKQEKAAGGPPQGPRSFSMVSAEGKTALKLVGEAAHDDHTHAEPHRHELPGAVPEPPPPNLDPSAAPPPAPPQESKETIALRRKAAERAALEESIIRQADGLICTQRSTLDGLRHLLRPRVAATVLGNGTNLPPPRPEVPKDIDVLYCGSLKPWKGVDTLVAAMQTLYPFKLTIVGPMVKQDVDRLRQAALAVGAVERLAILPAVRPADVWDLYARAKVGAIPLPGVEYVEARDFTSPLKLFEMMAAGLPIVCSRLKSLQEYVKDGREALMVPADDPRALAEGLRKMLSDEALRSGLAAAARARASEHTWDERGRKILTFAEELSR